MENNTMQLAPTAAIFEKLLKAEKLTTFKLPLIFILQRTGKKNDFVTHFVQIEVFKAEVLKGNIIN